MALTASLRNRQSHPHLRRRLRHRGDPAGRRDLGALDLLMDARELAFIQPEAAAGWGTTLSHAAKVVKDRQDWLGEVERLILPSRPRLARWDGSRSDRLMVAVGFSLRNNGRQRHASRSDT